MEFVSVEEKIPMSFEKAKEVYEILKSFDWPGIISIDNIRLVI